MEYRLKCVENPDEEVEIKTESLRKLPCIIDNQSNPVNHLHEGIKAVHDFPFTGLNCIKIGFGRRN